MSPVALIAANFLREHRWPVLILFAWIVFTALAAGDFGRARPAVFDVIFYLEQQAMYIAIFTAFLAATAIHNERKSRRILLLLSKAVSRADYLLAVIAGSWMMALAYIVVFVLCANWLTAHAMLPNGGLWPFAILIMAGVMIATTVALFFSTFCNPYLATALTGLLFCLPGFWHRHLHAWITYYPGFPVILQFFSFRFEADWAPRWEVVFAAMFDSAIFWTLAVLVFDRKDLAIPVE